MTAKALSIAVIDDDPLVLSGLGELLRENGFEPHTFSDSQSLMAAEPTVYALYLICLLYTSPSPRDRTRSRMPSSA